jgi:hypothetical protein
MPILIVFMIVICASDGTRSQVLKNYSRSVHTISAVPHSLIFGPATPARQKVFASLQTFRLRLSRPPSLLK